LKRVDRLEEELASLDRLRADPTTPDALKQLSAALRSGPSALAAKAALIAKDFELAPLTDDLINSFGRFFKDPAKTDRGCSAKIAIANALAAFGADAWDLFVRGIRHIQMEPSFGPPVDTAAGLRAACAFGLANSRSSEALLEIVALLADREAETRAGAARAIRRCGRDEGVLPLRLKALVGDEEDEVVLSCMGALIELSPVRSIPFVADFLATDRADVAIQALGNSRRPEAFEILRQRWESTADSKLKKKLLTAIGLTRQDAAIEFLVTLIEEESEHTASAALEALGPLQHDERIRAKLKAIRGHKSE
jgi:HEAT repeat protein